MKRKADKHIGSLVLRAPATLTGFRDTDKDPHPTSKKFLTVRRSNTSDSSQWFSRPKINPERPTIYLHVFEGNVELVVDLISEGGFEGRGQVLQGHVLQRPRFGRDGFALDGDAAEVGDRAGAGLAEDAGVRQNEVGRHQVHVDVEQVVRVDHMLKKV